MKTICKTAGILLMAAMLTTGCRDGKEKYTFRETGIGQLQAGQYNEAIQSFEQALEHSDGRVGTFELDVLKYRAEAEYALEDYEAAAHTYGILMQAEEEKPEYLNLRCLLLAKAGEVDAALADYEKSYALEPGTAVTEPALLALGEALAELDQHDKALELYQQAFTDGLQSAELYNRIGLCEMEAGNYDRALEYLTAGMEIADEETRGKLLYNQAAVYEQKLDFEKALELLESYVSTYGSTPEVEKEIAFLKTR